ncbi:MAG: hypothetical protein AAF645_20185, partial [Myxococcota bacterium]
MLDALIPRDRGIEEVAPLPTCEGRPCCEQFQQSLAEFCVDDAPFNTCPAPDARRECYEVASAYYACLIEAGRPAFVCAEDAAYPECGVCEPEYRDFLRCFPRIEELRCQQDREDLGPPPQPYVAPPCERLRPEEAALFAHVYVPEPACPEGCEVTAAYEPASDVDGILPLAQQRLSACADFPIEVQPVRFPPRPGEDATLIVLTEDSIPEREGRI